jgi:very-short-patch-repair endonuclease
MRGESRTGGVDAALAVLAERQHGAVARRQLIELGLRAGAIDRRVKPGRLHLLHRGVYAVGHRRLAQRGCWMAAVLATGPGAVLSYRSAASLWELVSPRSAAIEVTAPRECDRAGIKAHRTRLPRDEITLVDGIPVTTVPRTLLDLAALLTRSRLERTIERAEALRLTDPISLDELLRRYPRRKGTRSLREVVRRGIEPILTRSELEDRFLAFLEARGLPRPRVNVLIEGLEVDFVWPEQRLIVELDGRQTHATTAAFERDRERDRILQAAGWRVVRITWRQLQDDPAAIARDLGRLLEDYARFALRG